MDTYGIAAVSMAMSQAQVAQSASVSVAKKVMDTQETQAAALINMLPPSNHIIDTYA